MGHRLGGWFAGRGRPHPVRDKPLLERLWDSVAGPWVEGVEWDDCWLFTKDWRSKYGYGRIKEGRSRRSLQAHIVAFEQFYGPMPEGYYLRHACDVRLCCNPFHLAPGTHDANMRDIWDKGYAWACTPLGEPPLKFRFQEEEEDAYETAAAM